MTGLIEVIDIDEHEVYVNPAHIVSIRKGLLGTSDGVPLLEYWVVALTNGLPVLIYDLPAFLVSVEILADRLAALR